MSKEMIIDAAQRLNSVGEYYFSRKLEQIRQMNEAGRNVINLGIGSPDLPPRPEVVQAAVRTLQNPSNHGYAPYRSLLALRAAIAAWYLRVYRVKLDAEREVLPLLGSKEGLFYIAMAFLNPGDQALVPNPGYPAYASVTSLAGGVVLPYDLLEKNNCWPNFSELEKMDLSKVKIMWVNYPHMPTGTAAAPELFEKLVEFGRKHKILICHDNPYGMVLNQNPPQSILHFDPKLEVALELNSFSKAFNMAGWRVGMLLANQAVIDTVLKVKSNVDSGMFSVVQHGAIEALNSSEAWHQRRNATYFQRKVLAQKIFDKLGFTYQANQVGLFLWAKAPDQVTEVEDRVDEILDKSAVFLTPGFIFGTQGARYARCSLCVTVDKMHEALARLESV